MLLPAETDERIWAHFATAGVPDPQRVGICQREADIVGQCAQVAGVVVEPLEFEEGVAPGFELDPEPEEHRPAA